MPPFKLLFVDDSPDTLAAYAAYFQEHGFLVSTTTDPQEAIQIASTEDIHLAILDYSMPSINGGELAALLGGTARFPIMIVSGDVDLLPVRVRQSVTKTLAKHHGPKALLEAVKAILFEA